MSIPPVSNPIWNQLILGKVNWPLESLAIKIFLGSAKLKLVNDASSAQVSRLAQELHDLFVKNAKLPSVQKDMALFK